MLFFSCVDGAFVQMLNAYLERKRHAARRRVSRRVPVLMGGGGLLPSSPNTKGGVPIQSRGGIPILTWMEGGRYPLGYPLS